jgi:hypothetical protein
LADFFEPAFFMIDLLSFSSDVFQEFLLFILSAAKQFRLIQWLTARPAAGCLSW